MKFKSNKTLVTTTKLSGNYTIYLEYHKYIFLSLIWFVGPTIRGGYSLLSWWDLQIMWEGKVWYFPSRVFNKIPKLSTINITISNVVLKGSDMIWILIWELSFTIELFLTWLVKAIKREKLFILFNPIKHDFFFFGKH